MQNPKSSFVNLFFRLKTEPKNYGFYKLCQKPESKLFAPFPASLPRKIKNILTRHLFSAKFSVVLYQNITEKQSLKILQFKILYLLEMRFITFLPICNKKN